MNNNLDTNLDTLDHVALVVDNIEETVNWYIAKFNCQVTYQDSTWAMLKFANMSLAFVIPQEHPAHISIERTS